VNRERRYAGLALLLAVPMSQLGHALAYWLQGLQPATGVHAYFPTLFALLEGAAAAALLAALLVVAAARLLNPGWRRSGVAASFVPLLLALGAGQLLIYLGQETVELAISARAPAPNLVLFGLAGQAPVALLAALTLRWLSERMEPALRALRLQRSLALLCRRLAPVRAAPHMALVIVPRTRPSRNGFRAPPSLRSH
jgi:hypothetical protein